VLSSGAIQETKAAVLDRSIEHLGAADAMIIGVRRRLLEIVRAFDADGVPPPGVDNARLHRRRGVQFDPGSRRRLAGRDDGYGKPGRTHIVVIVPSLHAVIQRASGGR
jgi:hypothetical protein